MNHRSVAKTMLRQALREKDVRALCLPRRLIDYLVDLNDQCRGWALSVSEERHLAYMQLGTIMHQPSQKEIAEYESKLDRLQNVSGKDRVHYDHSDGLHQGEPARRGKERSDAEF